MINEPLPNFSLLQIEKERRDAQKKVLEKAGLT
jgi:hypothetical protein